MLDDNDSLLFFYINMKFCFIIVSDILIQYIKDFSSSFIAFKSSLKIINVMQSFSFVCERIRSLYLKIEIMLKKLCWPALFHDQRRIRKIMILCKNSVCTVL